MTQPGHRDRFEAQLERLGAAIRVLRTRRQLTQADVAARAGVAPDLIHRVERGAANPTFTTLIHIIAGLDAPHEALAEVYDELSAHRNALGGRMDLDAPPEA